MWEHFFWLRRAQKPERRWNGSFSPVEGQCVEGARRLLLGTMGSLEVVENPRQNLPPESFTTKYLSPFPKLDFSTQHINQFVVRSTDSGIKTAGIQILTHQFIRV